MTLEAIRQHMADQAKANKHAEQEQSKMRETQTDPSYAFMQGFYLGCSVSHGQGARMLESYIRDQAE